MLRLSGPAAGAVLARLTGQPPPAARTAVLRTLGDRAGMPLDRGLVLWFPAPASFTGEDVAELHVHGGPAVVAAVLAAVVDAAPDQPVRLAEAGEFTRRAFDNGRLDLTAVEGLADLIAARTESQRRAALRQADGGLNRLAESWRARLVGAAAHLEAAIDFVDEELPEGLDGEVRAALAALREEIAAALTDGRRGELARDGVQVVLAGPPNVGKSSLLNRLARRDVAIVSDIAGTTRDVIEVTMDLGGVPVVVADTAGLRAGGDEVETIGVGRAEARWRAADLPILVAEARVLAAPLPPGPPPAMILANKCDLANGPPPAEVRGVPVFAVSALTGIGLDAWIAALTERVAAMAGLVGDAAVITRSRHRAELTRAADALARSAGAPTLDLMAEDVRVAVHAIGRLTGAVDVEDLLDVIFRDFCIGK